MRPLHDNLWLLFPDEERTIGKVRIPSGAAPRWMDAVVVAAGPEAPPDVGVGDLVVARQFDGLPVSCDGLVLRCMPASKVMAVVEL